MLEALVDGQDDELAGAAEASLHQDAGEIGLGPGIVALVIVEDRLDAFADAHVHIVPEWIEPGSGRSRCWRRLTLP